MSRIEQIISAKEKPARDGNPCGLGASVEAEHEEIMAQEKSQINTGAKIFDFVAYRAAHPGSAVRVRVTYAPLWWPRFWMAFWGMR